MSSDRWNEVEKFYHAALEHEPTERMTFLEHNCPDEEVRREVQSLLKHEQTGDLLLEDAAWRPKMGLAAMKERSGPSLAPGTRLGRYEIVCPIGTGGMGEVYRARDPRLNREVAIKVLPEDFACDPERIARFEREARAAGALNHPNIVSVYDVGRENEKHWMASELVSGETLQRLIGRGPLAPRKVIEIAIQIADGLAAAHAADIVHRDLKPGNIMVTREGRVKILDFGLAKQRRTAADVGATATEDLTDTGVIMGTAAYMSPEQVRGEDVGHRSDIFSLGIILHEMLSGKRAFRGDSSIEVMNAILKSDPPELPASVPAALMRIVSRCLEKEPTRRFQSVGDLGLALSSVTSSLPAAVSTQKKRWFALGLSAALVLLASASVWFRGHPKPVETAERSLTRLTVNGHSFDPAISRDGKMLTYAAAIGGATPDIWVQQVAGGNAIQITHEKEGALLPSFSPDGTQIAYDSRGGIYEVPVLGGDARLITGDGIAPHYTPDGSAIVFLRLLEGRLQLFTVPRMGGTPVGISPVNVVYPFVLSSDGKKALAQIARKGSEQADIKRWWTISIPDGRLDEVEPPASPNKSQAPFPCDWISLDRRPYRQWVIVTRPTGDSYNFFRVPVSSDGKALSDAEQITFSSGTNLFASVSRDGKMVFASSNIAKKLWSIPMDTNQGRVTGERQWLTYAQGVGDENVSLSRDGMKAVLWSNNRIVVKDLGTGQEKQLAAGDGPAISPDGSFVVFSVAEGHKSSLYRVSTMGGASRRICQDCADGTRAPKGVSSDGSRVLEECPTDTGLDRIELIDMTTGGVKVVLSDPNHSLLNPYFSWDDKWVTFKMQLDASSATAARYSRLYITPVEHSVPALENRWIPLTSGEYADDKPQLSPNGNLLYFTSNRDGFHCFWAQRLDPRTKHPEGAPFAVQHLHDQQPAPNHYLRYSMDLNVARDKIVTTIEEFHSDIWMTQWAPGE